MIGSPIVLTVNGTCGNPLKHDKKKEAYRNIFRREEEKTIKSVMEAFGKDKEDYRAIGTFLVFTADKKEDLSNSECRKVACEVKQVIRLRSSKTSYIFLRH